jgi:6-pyruvoyl-tetrahydropterin synthase
MNRLFVDNLTVIDFSYFHPHRGVVGESWIVDVELVGELNDEGMVFDFGHVKKLLKAALDEGMDHTLAIPTALTGLTISDLADGDAIRVEYQDKTGALTFAYESPREAVYLLDSESVSIESARPLLEQHLNNLVPANVKQVHLNIRTEEIRGDFYHYSHGLKKHQGDCQRICHGHRSRIEIYRNGQRDTQTEAEWANRFADIYLITDEDQVDSAHAHLKHVGYEAEQGRFDVWLNPDQCYVMPTDTTVEFIAIHIAEKLAESEPGFQWKVRAYEGVQKGAIAWSGDL